jgi:molybdate transport system substrate-binding protein
VRLAFDSSAALAEQVAQGAPADVLATADEESMESVVGRGGTAGSPSFFATNRLVLVVPKANEAGISSVGDLDRPEVDYVVCVPTAPCGRIAARALSEAEVTSDPASEETDVKSVLSKVLLAEADAGLVYASDAVAASEEVQALDLAPSPSMTTRYPVAVLAEAEEPQLAATWVELVLSPDGQDVLRDHGLGSP